MPEGSSSLSVQLIKVSAACQRKIRAILAWVLTENRAYGFYFTAPGLLRRVLRRDALDGSNHLCRSGMEELGASLGLLRGEHLVVCYRSGDAESDESELFHSLRRRVFLGQFPGH